MSDLEDAAALLTQVQPLGPTALEAELGAAVAQHVTTRQEPTRQAPDPSVLERLRQQSLGHPCPTCGGTGRIQLPIPGGAP